MKMLLDLCWFWQEVDGSDAVLLCPMQKEMIYHLYLYIYLGICIFVYIELFVQT